MTFPRWISPVRSYPQGWFALALSAGCLSPAHDLGNTPDGSTPEVAAPPVALEVAPPQAIFGSEFAGLWLGEAENPLGLGASDVYRFPSGSTRILIDLRAPLDSTITFGEGPSLPPPTDPDAGYPPNAESYLITSGPMPPWEGYPYPLWRSSFKEHDLFALNPRDFFDPDNGAFARESSLAEEDRLIDGLLPLYYDMEELFRPWCHLQPPDSFCGAKQLARGPASLGVAYEEENACLHPEKDEPIDCGKAYLCSFHCPLLYDGESYIPPQLELRLSVEGLVGVFSQGAAFVNERGFLTPIGPVHFRRVE